jgi:hypothetical protein
LCCRLDFWSTSTINIGFYKSTSNQMPFIFNVCFCTLFTWLSLWHMFIQCLWIQTKLHTWILVCSLLVCGVYIPMGFIVDKTYVTWIFQLCPIKLESHKRWAFLALGPLFTIFIILIIFIVMLLKCKLIFSLFILGLMQKLEIWHVHFVISWKLNMWHIVKLFLTSCATCNFLCNLMCLFLVTWRIIIGFEMDKCYFFLFFKWFLN